MEEKIRAVQYGVGKMSIYTMRYMLEKGIEIVGAVDVNSEVIGKDIGEILGQEELGIVVTSSENAKEMLEYKKPDICVITTRSLIDFFQIHNFFSKVCNLLCYFQSYHFAKVKTINCSILMSIFFD